MPLKSLSQAEIPLRHRRRLELPVLMTIWLAVAAFSLAEGGWFYLAAGTVAVGVSFLALSRDQEVYVRRVFVNAGVLAATAIMLVEFITSRKPLLVTLGHYLILIQLCKLFEQKRNRDYAELLTMSMLLMVAGTLICDRIWFAAALLVFIAVACYAAMAFTLKRCLDAAASARLTNESDPAHAQLVAWNIIRDWPGKALRGRLAPVLGAILATGVIMFLLVPRTVWHGASAAEGFIRRHTAGFGSHVRLGETDSIYLSDEIVMTVTVKPQGAGRAVAAAPLYLRGRTYDLYRNSTWFARPGNFFIAPHDQAGGDTFVQEITCDAKLLPVIFGAYPAVRGDLPEGMIRFDSDLNMTASGPSRPGRTVQYTVWSWRQPLTDEQRLYLQDHYDAPKDPPPTGSEATLPVKELAGRWCRDLIFQRQGLPPGPQRDRLDLAIAERLQDKLRGSYRYTLDLAAANPDRDGVEDFLFHMKKGHCEYFASALAVMCRALGVRARLAAGFCPEAPAEPGKSFNVRARDAHAWTEVYTPSTHWVKFDPTPGGQWSPGRPWWSWFADTWQATGSFWNQKVIGYDEAARRSLGRWFINLYRIARDAISSALRTLRESLLNLLVHGYIDRALTYLSIALSGFAASLAIVLIGRSALRELHKRRLVRQGKAPPWPQMEFFAKLLSLLRRHGVELQKNLTPREHVACAAEKLYLPARAMNELVELYYSLRWGRASPAAGKILAAEQRVAEIAKTLGR
jgi:transglutaminase-like putative cysteine protease